jgi:hypothetical protein
MGITTGLIWASPGEKSAQAKALLVVPRSIPTPVRRLFAAGAISRSPFMAVLYNIYQRN